MKYLISTLILLFLVTPARQAVEEKNSAFGIVVIAHGANSEWNQQVLDLIAPLKEEFYMEAAFLTYSSPNANSIQEAVDKIAQNELEHIIFVPLKISSFSSHYREIQWYLGKIDTMEAYMQDEHPDLKRVESNVNFILTEAFDSNRFITAIVSDRIKELSINPASETVILLGHGPNGAVDTAYWMYHFREIAKKIKIKSGFFEVSAALLRRDAEMIVRQQSVQSIRNEINYLNRLSKNTTIVIPVAIAKGSLTTKDIPEELEGIDYKYTGNPLLPHPLVRDWIRTAAKEAFANISGLPDKE